jgi:hypothetical protein
MTLKQCTAELTNRVKGTDNHTLLGVIRALHLRIHLRDLDEAANAVEKPRVQFVRPKIPTYDAQAGRITIVFIVDKVPRSLFLKPSSSSRRFWTTCASTVLRHSLLLSMKQ